jgi:ribosomal protein L29
MIKIKELREKNKIELANILAEKREFARKLRFEIASKQIKNVRDLRNSKREISKILTLIKEAK